MLLLLIHGGLSLDFSNQNTAYLGGSNVKPKGTRFNRRTHTCPLFFSVARDLFAATVGFSCSKLKTMGMDLKICTIEN
jgi:hypothetical protein